MSLATYGADAYYHRSHHYYVKDNYEQALEDAQRVLRLAPNYVGEHYRRGTVYRQRGEDIYTLQDYQPALGSSPALAEVYTERGSTYLAQGEVHKATQDFYAAIQLDADAGLAYGQCGVAWCELGHWTKVKADWTVATLLRVDIRALFHTRYESIADFEQMVGIQMPAHIVAMLDPEKALEGIRSNGISGEELHCLFHAQLTSTACCTEHSRLNVAFRKQQRELRLKLALKAYDTCELSTGLSARLAGMSSSDFIYIGQIAGEFGETERAIAAFKALTRIKFFVLAQSVR